VRAAVDELQGVVPDDVSVFVSSDDAVFIEGAIREVVQTLGLAILIVVAIIYLFLRDARATLIPTLTIPVALIGTVAAIYLVGFSVNILTLLALVLATGMVVDDAIVVLENIVRRRGEGMGPRAAAVLGTRQVFFAVVATTATLAAVFVPLSFLPGQTGGLFREFGFTLAMAVLLSSFVALTLCPVLASKLLRAVPQDARPGPVARARSWLEAVFRPRAPALGARRAARRRRRGRPLRRDRGPGVGLDPHRAHAAGGPRHRADERQRAAGRVARLHQRQDARARGPARSRCATRARSPTSS
jgi:hydrophobic/amphiphilic exporter-1 (mainly G- bacteria), HAE1 family